MILFLEILLLSWLFSFEFNLL